MICHFCSRDTAAKCVSCGLAICPDHGKRYCQVCSNAVFSRETVTGQREQKGYLQCPSKPQMPTIYLDDDGPPACYKCEALARKVCQNCQSLYCREHAGKGGGGLCDQCAAASRVGTWVVLGMIGIIGGLSIFCFLQWRVSEF